MIGTRVLVRTPSRLHFGLLGWGPGSRRRFGGLGLMIESPAIELTVEPASTQAIRGPLAERAERILGILRDRLSQQGSQLPPLSIRTAHAPPEHVGLGVGTQLSLALAAAVLRLAGARSPSAEFLAQLTSRGRRSGIGLHGFHHGGLIVDGGRKDEAGIPPLLARLTFPESWSVLVIQPPGRHGLYGPDEVRAFEGLVPPSERMTERLCRIVLLDILPAVAERDLAGFGGALEELQADVGASFAPAQGGPFNSPRAAEIISALHQAGFVGCGQSSWGPTLYAFSDRPRAEVASLAEGLRGRLGLEHSAVIVTRAADHGAAIQEA
jgi:beta-ribofuranosylaminobenzene 5'-phosphate synthase